MSGQVAHRAPQVVDVPWQPLRLSEIQRGDGLEALAFEGDGSLQPMASVWLDSRRARPCQVERESLWQTKFQKALGISIEST